MSDPIAVPIWPVQAAMRAFYGPVGANLVPLVPPFVMTYDGHPVHSFLVNARCKDSLARVLTAIWEAASHSQAVVDEWGASIFGGCFNNRSMLNSSTPSCHAYGAAIDLDPARNPYTRDPHARHFTDDHPVVKAFKAEGWVWGGDWHGVYDAMHFQASRVH
jgi:hypothetical protein